MRRRKFVKATSGFAVAGLAGCTGNEDNDAPEVQPNARFSVEFDINSDTQNTLTFRLAEGDPVAAKYLYFRGIIDDDGVNVKLTNDEGFSQLIDGYSVSGVGGFSGDENTKIESGQGIEIAASDKPLESYNLDLVWDTGTDSATLVGSESPN